MSIRAAFVVFVLHADNAVNVDTLFPAPIENTNNAIRHFNGDTLRLFAPCGTRRFRLVRIVNPASARNVFVRSVVYAKPASVAREVKAWSPTPVFLQRFGQLRMAKRDDLRKAAFFVPLAVFNGVFVNLLCNLVNSCHCWYPPFSFLYLRLCYNRTFRRCQDVRRNSGILCKVSPCSSPSL